MKYRLLWKLLWNKLLHNQRKNIERAARIQAAILLFSKNYLAKPVKNSELAEILGKWLKPASRTER